jgi:phosphoribosylanthranilate isomerase
VTLAVKICGLSTEETVEEAVACGARMVGFVFFPKSPRAVTPRRAADLARLARGGTETCGLFVDESEETILRTLDVAQLDLVQLHGAEPPEFCARLRERSGRRVMKAIGVAGVGDVRGAARWRDAVDIILFDARPGPTLPGGNGVPFDWDLLAGRPVPEPWMLSGGLDLGNLEEAVRRTAAAAVDVSSGVESSPGIKDPALIRQFLVTARRL